MTIILYRDGVLTQRYLPTGAAAHTLSTVWGGGGGRLLRNWSTRTTKYMQLYFQMHILRCPPAPIPEKIRVHLVPERLPFFVPLYIHRKTFDFIGPYNTRVHHIHSFQMLPFMSKISSYIPPLSFCPLLVS